MLMRALLLLSVCPLMLVQSSPLLAEAELSLPELEIRTRSDDVRIDGDLGDPAWKNAVLIDEMYFTKNLEGDKSDKAKIRLTYDNENLYVACSVSHPFPEKIRHVNNKHDGAMDTDDSVEIFLDPGMEGKEYYHFMLNSGNVKAEQRVWNSKDRGWNGKWFSATKITKTGWDAEIAIPLNNFPPYADFSKARLNIGINSPGYESIIWSPTSSYHKPYTFGYLKGLKNLVDNLSAGPYCFEENCIFYYLRGNINWNSKKTGDIDLVVKDIDEKNNVVEISETFQVKPFQTKSFELPVAVKRTGGGRIDVLIKDKKGDVLSGVSLTKKDSLEILRAYVGRNYYTIEKDALIVCDVSLRKRDLRKFKMTARADGRLLAESSIIDKKTTITVPLSMLSIGTNRITLNLISKTDDSVAAEIATTLRKLPPKPGGEVKTDRIKGIVLMNDKPIFPVGIYLFLRNTSRDYQTHFKNIADAGFSTMVLCGGGSTHRTIPQSVEFVKAELSNDLLVIEKPYAFTTKKDRGLGRRGGNHNAFRKAFNKNLPMMLKAVDTIKTFPNLLSYYTFDEPSDRGIDAELGGIMYEEVEKVDGYHPFFAVYNRVPHSNEETDFYDILGTDQYWIPIVDSVTKVAKKTALTVLKAEELHLPVWVVLEAVLYSGTDKRLLTAAEQRCQSYLALINGAKGVFFFEYDSAIIHKTAWESLGQVAKELRVLGEYAVGPELKQNIEYASGICAPATGKFADVQVRLMRNAAGRHVLLAANSATCPVRVKVGVHGLKDGMKINRLFADDIFNVKNSVFQDCISANGCRVYSLPETFSLGDVANVRVESEPLMNLDKNEVYIPKSGEKGKRNIVRNPSFEECSLPGYPDYFRLTGRIGYDDSMSGVVDDAPYEGKRCLKVTVANEKTAFFFYSKPNFINENYVYSIYLKASKDGVKARLYAFNERNGKSQGKDVVLTKEWKRYELKGRVPARVGMKCMFGVTVYGRGNTVWADALQLEKGEEATGFQR